eukprot:15364525-Ditylum_brightwellii.AAC.1
MLHGTVLATLVAYDYYKEVCEGGLDPAWKKDDPDDYWTFCNILTTQISKRKASESADAAARASMSPTRQKCGHPSTSSSL